MIGGDSLAERNRIIDIWSISRPGFEALALVAAADANCTPEMFAKKLLEAMDAAGVPLEPFPKPTMH
jgi:hypothetical protein